MAFMYYCVFSSIPQQHHSSKKPLPAVKLNNEIKDQQLHL